MIRTVDNLLELEIFAKEIAAEIQTQLLNPKLARQLLLLDGPMGAGKTQFTRYLLEGLGSKEVTSPSFSIHNHYETSAGFVEHVDLYRIDNKDDLESTGFWDLFLETKGLIIIEWSDRLRTWNVAGHLPRNWPTLKLRFDIPLSKLGTRREILIQRSAGTR